MEPVELTRANGEATIVLQLAEHVGFGGQHSCCLASGTEFSESTPIITFPGRLAYSAATVGSVGMLTEMLESAPSDIEQDVVHLNDRLAVVSAEAPKHYIGPAKTFPPEASTAVMIRDGDCVVCGDSMDGDEEQICQQYTGYYSFFHRSCVEAFCNTLERVWEYEERLLPEMV